MSGTARNTFDSSPQRRALLERLRREANLAGAGSNPIQPRPAGGPAPLSFAQQRLWFLDQLAPGATFHIPIALHLSGLLDPDVLARSLALICERHAALRTTFAMADGQPVQLVAETAALALPVVALQALPPAEREAEVRRLTREQALQTFDLARGPLLRTRLLRLALDEHILLLTVHHIAADDWSLGLLLRELGAVYSALAAGQPAALPELPVDYADFAVWQRGQADRLAAVDLDYWRQRLAGPLPVLDLSTDRPRPTVQDYAGATEAIEIGIALTEGLRALAQREGVNSSS